MTNYKEILRLHSLGINNTRIAESCGCARSTVISTVKRAQEKGITWEDIRSLGETEVARKLYPATSMGRQYKMPDYEYIHREMQKSGVTLSLLWVEYCEQCQANGELPYQSTQFNKYYADFVCKTKATLRLEHKPGEAMQVDWAGQTAHILDEWLLYPLKESEARDVLELVEARSKTASTIFCSQFDVPGWHENLYDPTLADAICDRIVYDSYIIRVEGDSMRKRKGIMD